MGNINRAFALMLIGIIVISCISLLTVKPTDAQSIPKPSVPEFTVEYVDRSYTVPATTTVDPYTGQSVTNPSHYVENRTLEIAIKNQPFTPYVDSSTGAQWQITLMYQIRTKGHFAQNWTNLYFAEDGFLPASNSSYTTVSPPSTVGGNLQANSQVDFQVQAMIGYVSRTAGFMSWYFTGESSDWSSTKTITLPASAEIPDPTASPTQTSSTAIPTQTAIEIPVNGIPSTSFLLLTNAVALIVIAVLLAVIVVLMFLRHRKTADLKQ